MLYTGREITDDGDVTIEPFRGAVRASEALPYVVLTVKGTPRQLDRQELEGLRDACDEALA